MSILAERLESAPMLKGHNIVTLDIERLPGTFTADFWDLNAFKNRRIHPDYVVSWPRTICIAWRVYGTKKVEFVAEWQPGGAEAMLLAAWEVYDRAEIVVGHNVDRFDGRALQTGWLEMGLPMPSPVKTVDTLKVARKHFSMESNTLDAICRRLGIAHKTDKYDVQVAKAAVDGHVPSQRRIKAYNVGDIYASEALYDRLRGRIPNHPHVTSGNALDVISCNQCNGRNLERNGIKLAQQITYLLYRCQGCGANVQGTRHSRAATTRGAV